MSFVLLLALKVPLELCVIDFCLFMTVLPSETRPDFFLATLPAVARIARAFPPLCDDIVGLLLQVGQVCRSQLACYTQGGPHTGEISKMGATPSWPATPEVAPHMVEICNTLLVSKIAALSPGSIFCVFHII